MHPWRRLGPPRVIVAACMALAAPASAQAADGVIDGSPLNIYANDVGRLQAGFDGVASGEFYTGALMPNDGGISVAVQAVGANAFTVYGRAGGRTLTPVSAPVVTGNGSAGTPWRLTTAFRATDPATGGDLLDVNEVLEYVNGTGDLTVTYMLSAPTALSNVRLYHSASVLPASSYLATGFLVPGPARRVGAQALGRDSGGSRRPRRGHPVVCLPGGDRERDRQHDQRGEHGRARVQQHRRSHPLQQRRGDGRAVEPGSMASPATVAVTWHFSRTSSLALAVPSVAQTTGQTVQVPVTARDDDGGPDAGLAVRYTITGVSAGSGAVTTGADGTATDQVARREDRHRHPDRLRRSRRQWDVGRQHRAAPDRDRDLRAAPPAGPRQGGQRRRRLRPGLRQARPRGRPGDRAYEGLRAPRRPAADPRRLAGRQRARVASTSSRPPTPAARRRRRRTSTTASSRSSRRCPRRRSRRRLRS